MPRLPADPSALDRAADACLHLGNVARAERLANKAEDLRHPEPPQRAREPHPLPAGSAETWGAISNDPWPGSIP